jgi:ABC-type multidrug transport system fused ATPase/permease subunit
MFRSPATLLIFRLIEKHWGLAIMALSLAFTASLLEGISAALVMPILQILGNNNATTSLQLPNFLQNLTHYYTQLPENHRLIAVIASFFAITAIKNINRYFSNISVNQLQLKAGLDLRKKCVDRFLTLDLLFYNQSKLGELLSYINEHVQRSEVLASYVLEIVSDSLTIFVLLTLLIGISPTLTGVAIFSLLIITVLLKPIVRSVQLYGRKAADSIDSFSFSIAELISGIRVVKGFNAESRELERADTLLKTRYDAELSAYKYSSSVAPLTETTGITVLLMLLAIGATLLSASSSATLPLLLTYTLALLRILPRLSHLNSLRSQISLFSGSLESIQHFLSSTKEAHLIDGYRLYTGFQSEIAFENVTFTFPGNTEPTLKQVSFTIPKGKIVALVGASGSGKSTLADLAMRFYDPEQGSIKADGIDLRDFQIGSWRKSLAMVSQDTFLFHASVRENIAYGLPHATQAEIIAAAQKAYAYEFIQELPQGLDTIVGNRGTKLSGGQRQRLAIARAILCNPELLILDEATSALDMNSERIVQKALEEVSQNRTVIVIAHRLSTIENADQIIAIENGKISEQGTPETLLKEPSRYLKLYESQRDRTNSPSSLI